MKINQITETIQYIGMADNTLDLFESQYAIPDGVTYNSYLIRDDKIAIMDTVDARMANEWIALLDQNLKDITPDYLVISHMEPDHSGTIGILLNKYPKMTVVGNEKTFRMLTQFFPVDLDGRSKLVKEGDTLNLGYHKLHFYMAPMVHWPEVMVTYDETEHVLFTADAFGTFGILDSEKEWIVDARRYYINIVGKYGSQVQALLKKVCPLNISILCSLHGPVLKDNLSYYLDKYNTWSSYTPEDEGILIAYASIHGHTATAAKELGSILHKKGAKNVILRDLTRSDLSEVIENAYRYDRMVLACATYDGNLFPVMEDFLSHLKAKNYQKRTVGIMENGSWAPMAGKKIRESLESMKEMTICDPLISIKSAMSNQNLLDMEALADRLLTSNSAHTCTTQEEN